MERREFLKAMIAAGAGALAASAGGRICASTGPAKSAVFVGKDIDPGQAAASAISAFGGMERIVRKGSTVVVKPNMSWDRFPEQAANTNPQVVAKIVELCYKAGAKSVKVFDRTVNEARRCYDRSGIADAARASGADVSYVRETDSFFEEVKMPRGKSLKSWPVYRAALEADVLINLPVAKHHTASTLTLGMKNLMGLAGGNRGSWHQDIHQKIADINTGVRIDLTVLDAYRILTAHGPQGGNLSDVQNPRLVIAGTDRVAVDAYAATLFGLKPGDVSYVMKAQESGLGTADLNEIEVKTS